MLAKAAEAGDLFGGTPAWKTGIDGTTITFATGVAATHEWDADIDRYNAAQTAVFYDLDWAVSAFRAGDTAGGANLQTLGFGDSTPIGGVQLERAQLVHTVPVGASSTGSMIVELKVSTLREYNATYSGRGQATPVDTEYTFTTPTPDAAYTLRLVTPSLGSAPFPLVIWLVGLGGKADEYDAVVANFNDMGFAVLVV
jgi:hypothetical protein